MEAQVNQLIKKVNQIAANQMALNDEALIVAKVHEHLAKFWSPLMKQQICDYARLGQGELSDVAFLAVQKFQAGY